MKAFMGLMADMTKMETKWIVWIFCLMAVNLYGGYIFIDTLEGKMAISFMLIGAGIMSYLYKNYGYTRILGAGHVLWLYLVPHCAYLYTTLKPSHFKGWLFMVAVFNGISLIIDITDVYRYMKGDTAPTIPVEIKTEETEEA